MCGDYAGTSPAASWRKGSPPHVRGLRTPLLAVRIGVGITPACAGTTPRMTSAATTPGDHPRMCGDYRHSHHLRPASQGSPPHVRGLQPAERLPAAAKGITPACAGTTDAET